jgi:hypothetical protein
MDTHSTDQVAVRYLAAKQSVAITAGVQVRRLTENSSSNPFYFIHFAEEGCERITKVPTINNRAFTRRVGKRVRLIWMRKTDQA